MAAWWACQAPRGVASYDRIISFSTLALALDLVQAGRARGGGRDGGAGGRARHRAHERRASGALWAPLVRLDAYLAQPIDNGLALHFVYDRASSK